MMGIKTLLLAAALFHHAQAFVLPTNNRVCTVAKMVSTSSSPSQLPDIRSMHIGDIRRELQSYGVNSFSFFEKSDLVHALRKARERIYKANSSSPYGNAQYASSSRSSNGPYASSGGGNNYSSNGGGGYSSSSSRPSSSSGRYASSGSGGYTSSRPSAGSGPYSSNSGGGGYSSSSRPSSTSRPSSASGRHGYSTSTGQSSPRAGRDSSSDGYHTQSGQSSRSGQYTSSSNYANGGYHSNSGYKKSSATGGRYTTGGGYSSAGHGSRYDGTSGNSGGYSSTASGNGRYDPGDGYSQSPPGYADPEYESPESVDYASSTPGDGYSTSSRGGNRQSGRYTSSSSNRQYAPRNGQYAGTSRGGGGGYSSRPYGNGSTSSSSSYERTAQEEWIRLEMRKACHMGTDALRLLLHTWGISTDGMYRHQDYLRAYAEAVVMQDQKEEEVFAYDPEYRDVVVQPMLIGDPRAATGRIIDIELRHMAP